MDTQDRPTSSFHPGAVLGGLLLLAVGVGLLVEGRHVLQLNHLVAPFVLIVLGVVTTLERGVCCTVPAKDDNEGAWPRTRPRRGLGGGVGLIGIGIWMLISQNQLWGFTFETSWPLLIVFMGVMMVLRGWL